MKPDLVDPYLLILPKKEIIQPIPVLVSSPVVFKRSFFINIIMIIILIIGGKILYSRYKNKAPKKKIPFVSKIKKKSTIQAQNENDLLIQYSSF